MPEYELYICATKYGCKTLIKFKASNDSEAAKIGTKSIDDYESENDDYIYREYLFRKDNQGQVEIAI